MYWLDEIWLECLYIKKKGYDRSMLFLIKINVWIKIFCYIYFFLIVLFLFDCMV